MVIFMLHDPRGHPDGFAFDHSAGDILAAKGDSRRALHRAAQAGDGKAAFPGFLDLLPQRLNFRVEQSGMPASGRASNRKPKGNMDLRGGEPKPADIFQGFHHIGDQAAHLGRCGVCHRFRPLQQHGMAQPGDFQNGHDIPAPENEVFI